MEQMGDVPQGITKRIRKKVAVDPSRIAAIEQVTKHDVIAFLESIAEQAGIPQETLSRAKKAADIQLATLSRLAGVVGLKVSLVPAPPVLEKILSGDLFSED